MFGRPAGLDEPDTGRRSTVDSSGLRSHLFFFLPFFLPLWYRSAEASGSDSTLFPRPGRYQHSRHVIYIFFRLRPGRGTCRGRLPEGFLRCRTGCPQRYNKSFFFSPHVFPSLSLPVSGHRNRWPGRTFRRCRYRKLIHVIGVNVGLFFFLLSCGVIQLGER